MKYLVMEVSTSYAVLLDEEGKMQYAANLHYTVGQTVENPILMRNTEEVAQSDVIPLVPKKSTVKQRFLKALLPIAACLVLCFYSVYYINYVQPYSTITLSINPQVEMQLSRRGSVVGLRGLNTDGENLLEGYILKTKDKQEVANALVLRAAEMGYLKEGGTVSYTIDVPKPELYSQYQEELKASYDHEISDEIDFDFDLDIHEADDDDDDDDDDRDDWDDKDDDDEKEHKEDKKHEKKPIKDPGKNKEESKQNIDKAEDEEENEIDDENDDEEDEDDEDDDLKKSF